MNRQIFCLSCKTRKFTDQFPERSRGANLATCEACLRFCKKCGKEAPDEFYATKSGSVVRICRTCHTERVKAMYLSSPKARATRQTISKDARVALRQRVIAHYSGNRNLCECCGVSEFAFLAIDHIDGGGVQHRKEIGLGGQKFYRWLEINGFPTGYRVLCHNCNLSRGFYGYCPHEREAASTKDASSARSAP